MRKMLLAVLCGMVAAGASLPATPGIAASAATSDSSVPPEAREVLRPGEELAPDSTVTAAPLPASAHRVRVPTGLGAAGGVDPEPEIPAAAADGTVSAPEPSWPTVRVRA